MNNMGSAHHTEEGRYDAENLADQMTCILGPLGALGGKLLHDMGFSNVQILEGGVQAWIDAGLLLTRNRELYKEQEA